MTCPTEDRFCSIQHL